MNGFKDRISSDINKRKLHVLGVDRDNNGELKELLVNMERAEGTVSQTGTRLNASDLNAILNSIYGVFDFIFKPYLTLENNLTVSWVQVVGNPKNEYLNITTSQRFYGKIVNNSSTYISVTCSNYSSYIRVNIVETDVLNESTGSSTREFTFYVDLYADSGFTKYLTRVKGTVNYTNTSTNPSD
jgi:hypothetical protein